MYSNALRRSLPIPPPNPAQIQARFSMPTRNMTPVYQTMQIRTHTYAKPSLVGNRTTDQFKTNRGGNTLFSSFGKGDPERNNDVLQVDPNFNFAESNAYNSYNQRLPRSFDQRRTLYYYNDIIGCPSTDLSSPDENSPILLHSSSTVDPIPDSNVIDGGNHINEEQQLPSLSQNTLDDGSALCSSAGSLDQII